MNPFAAQLAAAEAHVRTVVTQTGPLAAYRQLLAENDAGLRGADLTNGRALASARTAVHSVLVGVWAEAQQRRLGYDRPFAVAAVGGTGRGELSPCSDLDFVFLFDNAVEGNGFLLELQRLSLHTEAFRAEHGFSFAALPFSLDDMPPREGRQLNSLIDLRPVYEEPAGFTESFRERIRATYDPFEHCLHVRQFWKDGWAKACGEWERLDRFDLKHEALRVFLAGVWTLAGRRFTHAHDIYTEIDPRVLQAYETLLRIRGWVHLRKIAAYPVATAPGSHAEDVVEFEDLLSFGELLGPDADESARFEFANEVRARLISARRQVAQFAHGVIEREMQSGRTVPGTAFVLGPGGLGFRGSPIMSPEARSRAALGLLLAAQHYGVPVDPAELQEIFHDAGTWMLRVPELAALFYEPDGSFADTLHYLAQLDGVPDRLFPGFSRFEASLDRRVLAERRTLRSAYLREKIRTLENWVREGRATLSRTSSQPEGVALELEAARLDADNLAAVKLALVTKRLPVTEEDRQRHADPSRPLHERHASGFSGIPVDEYFAPFGREAGFAPGVLRLVEFLLRNRRALRTLAEAGLNDSEHVASLAHLVGDESTLRALFVFTAADAQWEFSPDNNPALWFNLRELHLKALRLLGRTKPPSDTLARAGYSPAECAVLEDFGHEFFSSSYRQYAHHFGSHLIRLAEQPDRQAARAAVVRDGTALIIGVAARDYRGLAASITGAFYYGGVALAQAHLFSASRFGLALDFFHVAPGQRAVKADFPRLLEDAINRRLHIRTEDEALLPALRAVCSLSEWRPGGRCCLRCEVPYDHAAAIYTLAYKVYRHLQGNIFALAAHAAPARSRLFVSIYFSLPPEVSFAEAQRLVAQKLQPGFVSDGTAMVISGDSP